MKILIIYYSRTNTTKTVAESLAQYLSADVEQIYDTKNRMGPLGYVRAGRDAMKQRLTKLQPLETRPEHYDLVIIGTPVWSWNLSTPIRTYLTQFAERFENVAFFLTRAGSDPAKIFHEMQNIIQLEPMATLALTTKEVREGNSAKLITDFVRTIQE